MWLILYFTQNFKRFVIQNQKRPVKIKRGRHPFVSCGINKKILSDIIFNTIKTAILLYLIVYIYNDRNMFDFFREKEN